MTKISKKSLALRCKRLANHAALKNKPSIKRMKLAVCEEFNTSSSDDDNWPMLPPTSSSSSSSLSPIEEEKNSALNSSVSSTSQSKYLSSLCYSSISSLSSNGNLDRYKELHDKFDDIEKKIEALGCSSKKGESSKSFAPQDDVVVSIESKIHKSTQCDEFLHDERHSIVEDIEHIGLEMIQSSLNRNHPDIESYHQSKNFAFLLLNLALLSSNGNQIKYLLESPEQRPFFYYSLSFIVLSLVFQFIAKAFSLSSYRYNLSSQEGASKLRFINGFLLIFTMIITVLNIGISVLILFEIYEILPL